MPRTVVVLGDSLSAGYGITVQEGWVNLLAQRISSEGYGYKVINASVSGETTQGGLARLPRVLQIHKPAVVVIELGGNDGLRGLPDREVVATLVAVPGIGVWTAEIYAMFALGRADVFAPGDLALQEAARMLFGLDRRPTDKALRAMAEEWSPWRSVAARILWAYYRVMRQRDGAIG